MITSAAQVSELAEEIKCESLERVAVDNSPERFFQVDSELPLQEKEELVGFLRKNVDVFAWDTYDAPGVDPSFICRYLNVNLSSIPKKQPPRRPSKEHVNAIRDEVMKLKRQGLSKKFFPRMDGKYGGGKKEDGEMVSLRRLHRLQQGVPEGPVPVASDRPIG